MTVNELTGEDAALAFEHVLSGDQRVQEEFEQLNQLLAEIDDHPVTESPTPSDPNWHINDYEVSRWRIVLEGNTRLDRIAAFREKLYRRDDILDVSVESFDCGQISIRLVTTGGIPMGPIERAVCSLTSDAPPRYQPRP